MSGIEDALRERAEEGGESFQTPVVQIIAALEEDIDNTEATRLAGLIRREVLLVSSVAQRANSDHTVNAVGVDTISAIEYEDVQEIRSVLRNTLRDEGYTINSVAIQADVQTTSL
jgi:hypothetical protein